MTLQTFEIGIRYPWINGASEPYLQIGEKFAVDHYQIYTPTSYISDHLTAHIKSSCLQERELSLHVEAIAGCVQHIVGTHNIEELLVAAKANRIKFVVLPLLNEYVDEQFLIKIKNEAEKNRVFVCFNVLIDEQGEHIRTSRELLNLIESIDTRFLLLSIELTFGTDLKQLDDYLGFPNSNRIGLITVKHDDDILRDDFKIWLSEMLHRLYYMPYRQRPIIFSASSGSLMHVLDFFYNTVKFDGLWYP